MKTLSGRECKLCIQARKKGKEFCHIHSQASATISSSATASSSARKSRSKSVSSITSILGSEIQMEKYNFGTLHKDILIKIMLGLPKKDLIALCKTSRKYRDICRLASFKKEYEKRHLSLFKGELSWEFDGRFFIGEDRGGNQLEIGVTTSGPPKISHVSYRSGKYDRYSLNFNVTEQSLYLNFPNTAENPDPGFLASIGKEHWLETDTISTVRYFTKDLKLTDRAVDEFKTIVNEEIIRGKSLPSGAIKTRFNDKTKMNLFIKRGVNEI